MFLKILAEDSALLDAIPAGWWKYVLIALAVIKVAEVVVKLTPNKTDDKILKLIHPIAKWLSLNVPDVDEVKKTDDPKAKK
jgi:hypothetical protein